MNSQTPDSKPNISLYLAIAVAIALLVGVGVGVGLSNYQKAEPNAVVAQPQPTPAKPSGRDPNIAWSIVKEPENTDPIDLTCDFNIKDYVENPYGYKHKNLSGAFVWINNFIPGGVKKGTGKAIAQKFEVAHFAKRSDSDRKIFHTIGNKYTANNKYYLVLFEPPTNYTFIETPEHIAKRLAISPDTLNVSGSSCAAN